MGRHDYNLATSGKDWLLQGHGLMPMRGKGADAHKASVSENALILLFVCSPGMCFYILDFWQAYEYRLLGVCKKGDIFYDAFEQVVGIC